MYVDAWQIIILIRVNLQKINQRRIYFYMLRGNKVRRVNFILNRQTPTSLKTLRWLI